MSGTTQSSGPYSFGQILFANLGDADVRTGVVDWRAVAFDVLAGFSEGTLGALGKIVENGGLPAGAQLITANARPWTWELAWAAESTLQRKAAPRSMDGRPASL